MISSETLKKRIARAEREIEKWQKQVKFIEKPSSQEIIYEINRLYWCTLEKVSVIEDQFRNLGPIRRFIVPHTTAYLCARCNTKIMVTSRANFEAIFKVTWKEQANVRKHLKRYCETCQSALDEEEHREKYYEFYHPLEMKKETERLKKLPYSEYLETPHWKKVRGQALRRFDYTCQVCNSKNTTLHVHHRNYDCRGEENWKDLLVLCDKCHELFHKNGRLAK